MNKVKWFPVKEKLPELRKYVLISETDGFGHYSVTLGRQNEFGRTRKDGTREIKWFTADGYPCIREVIAWAELPEPYKKDK